MDCAPRPLSPGGSPAPRHDTAAGLRHRPWRPLLIGLVTVAAFAVTVIVLALQAGTGAAMLTLVCVVVGALVLCGLWGTALAVRESEVHLSSALGHELAEHTPSRAH